MAMEMMNTEEINLPKPTFTPEELKEKIEENESLKELYEEVEILEKELSELRTSENPSADSVEAKQRAVEDSRNAFARYAAGLLGGKDEDYKLFLGKQFAQAA